MPFSGPLVVKNGSKILSSVSGGMPEPVSVTRRTMYLRRPASGSTSSVTISSAVAAAASRVSVPPSGMASRAFTQRLSST